MIFVCYLYKNSKINKGGKTMENEKIENKKISESDLEKAAGGYTPVRSRL